MTSPMSRCFAPAAPRFLLVFAAAVMALPFGALAAAENGTDATDIQPTPATTDSDVALRIAIANSPAAVQIQIPVAVTDITPPSLTVELAEDDTASACEFELREASEPAAAISADREPEEPYRWQAGDLCGWGTHDSCPIATLAQASRASTLDRTLAAAATTASAGTGISVEQIIEPFAMVGPEIADTFQRVKDFQRWWQEAIDKAREDELALLAEAEFDSVDQAEDLNEFDVSHVETDAELVTNQTELATSESAPVEHVATTTSENSLNEEISELAAEEPIDIDHWGESILVNDELVAKDEFGTTEQPRDAEDRGQDETSPAAEQEAPATEVTPEPAPLPDPISIIGAAESQVGASAVIVSIEDSYLPYDLSARDLKVWSVFPMVTEPFCVRTRTDLGVCGRVWDDLDLSVGGHRVADNRSDTEAKVVTETEPVAEAQLASIEEVTASSDELVASDEVAPSALPAFVGPPLPVPPEPTAPEQRIATPRPEFRPDLTMCGSADCLLDELIWDITIACEEHPAARFFRADAVGRQVAAWTIQREVATHRAANVVSQLWRSPQPAIIPNLPAIGIPPQDVSSEREIIDPSAGDKLLARAGAVAAETELALEASVATEPAPQVRIAESPDSLVR